MRKPSEILKDYARAVRMVDPAKFDFLKEEIPERIKIRTRLGKGVDAGELGWLDPLSPNYVLFRKGKMSFRTKRGTKRVFPIFNFKKPELSQFTSPGRSNLTLTGKMLDSIVGTRSGFKFTFYFNTKEADDKAKWAREKGRNFFELSRSEKQGFSRKIEQIIKDTIRELFKS